MNFDYTFNITSKVKCKKHISGDRVAGVSLHSIEWQVSILFTMRLQDSFLLLFFRFLLGVPHCSVIRLWTTNDAGVGGVSLHKR